MSKDRKPLCCAVQAGGDSTTANGGSGSRARHRLSFVVATYQISKTPSPRWAKAEPAALPAPLALPGDEPVL
jgi:hypothetical protein